MLDPRGFYVSSASTFLPWDKFFSIRKQWAAGKEWWLCSLVYKMTRTQIAEIVTADIGADRRRFKPRT